MTRRAIRLRGLDARLRGDFARSHDGREADIVALHGDVGLTGTYVEAALPAGPPAGELVPGTPDPPPRRDAGGPPRIPAS